MMDYSSIAPIISTPKMGQINSGGYPVSGQELVKKEFAAIFYRELLKQAFSSQSELFKEEQNNLLTNNINQDMLIEKMAEDLARKNMKLME